MRISRRLYDGIVSHAQECSPQECCGVIGVQGDEVTCIRRTANVAADPIIGYEIGDVEGIVYDLIRRRMDLGAVYHSHPFAPPVPSEKDIAMWGYPDVLMVIVSLQVSTPEARAFRIESGVAVGVVLTVVED